jgi:aminoglycoside phosphotransferase (APT) family kinase protein
MTQTLSVQKEGAESAQHTPTYTPLPGQGAHETERPIDRFVSELRRMTPQERIEASRYTMNRWEYWVYAARFPGEVPTVNGELERIAFNAE